MNIVTTTNETRWKNVNESEKGKVIRKASLARQILAAGGEDVRIIDLKVDRDDPDHKRTVFVFSDNDKFQRVFASVLEENRKAREKDGNAAQQIAELNKKIEELSKKLEEKE